MRVTKEVIPLGGEDKESILNNSGKSILISLDELLSNLRRFFYAKKL